LMFKLSSGLLATTTSSAVKNSTTPLLSLTFLSLQPKQENPLLNLSGVKIPKKLCAVLDSAQMRATVSVLSPRLTPKR